jgi:putative PIN family toxin of toxin-antitoxin system
MRAVVDTNVIVSAALSRGSAPDQILKSSERHEFEIATSPALLRELETVIARPKIADRLGWSADERRGFVAGIRGRSIVVSPKRSLDIIATDPDDDRVLEAAVEAGADYIVSGDRDLLEVGEYEGIRIVTPARFAALLAMDLA